MIEQFLKDILVFLERKDQEVIELDRDGCLLREDWEAERDRLLAEARALQLEENQSLMLVVHHTKEESNRRHFEKMRLSWIDNEGTDHE